MVTTKPNSKAQGNPLLTTGPANDPAMLLKIRQLVKALNASRSETEDLAPELLGLINKKGIARAVSLSVRSVEYLTAKKLIPVIRLSPRCVRYSLPSVLRALKRFEVKEVTR